MTYMATIYDVVRSRDLEEWPLPDWTTRLPIRPLYVAPELFDWVEQTPATYDGTIKKGGRTPLEHLELFFVDLRCAERPSVSDFHRMIPNREGVWKCHPPTLRIFGWCYAPFGFAPVAAALERDLKAAPELYEESKKKVLRFMLKHGLEGTVMRGDHRAVFPNS